MSSTIRRRLVQHINLSNVVLYPPEISRATLTLSSSSAKKTQTHGITQVRFQSTSSTSNNEPHNTAKSWLFRGSGIRVSTLFNVLLAFGAGATVLGLYEVYTSFTLWPIEIRKDLRAGIRAKEQGDYALSERFLARAFQTAMTLPLSVLGSDPYLKLSGIAAVLAEVSPERRAKEVLRNVWDKGDESASTSAPTPSPSTSKDNNDDDDNKRDDWSAYTLTKEERLRRVAVACKLAELCTNDDAEEERWLVWAVEETLRLAGVATKRNSGDELLSDNGDTTASGSGSVILAELALPSWMRRVDLGAPLAALGALYAGKGNIEYAMPLYLQAISLLLPPNMNVEQISVQDRCEAAQLMNNLSGIIMRRPPSPEIRHQAEAWARQAYGLIQCVQETPLPRRGWFNAREDGALNDKKVCDQVLGVVLFNLGMLREMDEDGATARTLYEQSLRQCEKVGMKEGVLETKQALRRLGRATQNSNST